MKRIIPILGCCILFSCQPVKEVVERQIVLNEEKVIVSDTSLFGKSEMITLELTDESVLKNADKVILFGDKIGIVDYSMYSFLVFDHKGRFLYKIQNRGTGPGEYIQLFDVCLDKNNSRLAFATFPNAVLFYDYDGKFQQKVELEDIVHGMSLKGDLIYFLLADRRDGVVNDTSLEVLNYVTGEKKKILEQGVRPVKSLWTRGSTLSSGKDACYYVERYTNKVYKLAGDSCELLFRLNLGKHNLPENMLVEDIDMEKFRDQCSENRYVFSLVNFSELNNGFIMTSDRSGFFHYDKKKDALNHYDFIENTEHGVDFSYMPPLESEKDKIAFVVGEYQIAAAKTHMTDSRDEKIKTFLNNIPEDTNPILFLYDLKKTTH